MIKPIPGYEGIYEIDDSGIVWSLKHPRGNVRKKLGIHLNTKGYPHITLCKDKIRHNFRTHRLVAELFIPNPCNMPQVNHKNGDKTDNRVENLEWCDNAYNVKHSFDNLGRIPAVGENSANSKLTSIQVEDIWKNLHISTKSSLAKKYGVSVTTIYYIAIGRTWRWLTKELDT